jgi:hypothetical protein
MNLEYLLILSLLYLISLFILILIDKNSRTVTGNYLELIGPENRNLLKLKTIAALRTAYALSILAIVIVSFYYLSLF